MTTAELPARLLERLGEHYQPLARELSVDLAVDDDRSLSGRFTFGAALSFDPAQAASRATPAHARIGLRGALLHAMLDDPQGFDARGAFAQALGGIRIEGSPTLAGYWLQLFKRPPLRARRVLARALARAPAALDYVPGIDASGRDAASGRAIRAAVAVALRSCVPLVLRGILRWPELDWNLDDWRSREGATRLRRDPVSGAWQSVGTFLAALRDPRAGLACYTDGCALPPAWEARFALPLPAQEAFGAGQLWAGCSRGATPVTRLHCDAAGSFLAQVYGRKRVRVYAPAQQHALYALDAFNMYRPCQVDCGEPDFARFPRFAHARGADVTIAPGDLLVLPAGWFHAVWALDDVLSISRFASDAAILRACRSGES